MTKRPSKGHRGGARKRQLNIETGRPTSMALKFYDEQLQTKLERAKYADNSDGKVAPDAKKGLTAEQLAIRNEARARFVKAIMALPSSEWECLVVCHDKDVVVSKDDLFKASIKKPHFHVIIRRVDGKRFSVKWVLKHLGINYDGKKDYGLFYKHGCESIDDFSAYAMYLTHETDEAIAEMKHVYPVTDIISNLSLKRVEEIRDGYHHAQKKDKKLNEREWQNLINDAYAFGFKHGDYDDFKKKYMTSSQQVNSREKLVEESYQKGINDFVNTNTYIPRMSILIKGGHGVGKTYSSHMALNQLFDPKRVLKASTSTGMYDALTVNTEALVLDDLKPKMVFSLADRTAIPLYRRNKGHAPWIGYAVIATTNDDVDVWFSRVVDAPASIPNFLEGEEYDNYQKKVRKSYDESLNAAKSRFYICHVGTVHPMDTMPKFTLPCLVVDSKPDRGAHPDKKVEEMFSKFEKLFNEFIQSQFKNEYTESKAEYHQYLQAEIEKKCPVFMKKKGNGATNESKRN